MGAVFDNYAWIRSNGHLLLSLLPLEQGPTVQSKFNREFNA